MLEEPAIRLAIASDAPGVSALIHSQLHHRSPKPAGPAPPEFLAGFSVETMRDCLVSNRYRYLVASIEGQLVGVLGIRDEQHLLHFFVSEPYQRQGIGRALWCRARSDLLATTGEIRIVVNSSIYAIPVYERFGFRASGPRVEDAGITYLPMQIEISAGRS